MQKIDRLIQLNQKLRGIVEFRYGDDDTGGRAGSAIAGGAAGVGGLKLWQHIQKRRGELGAANPQMSLGLPGIAAEKASFGEAAKSVGQEGWDAVKNVFSKLRGAVPK